jgi:hypothetical protein
MFYGQGLELHDINIGKKQYGFRRARESDPLEPLYPTEPMETPEMSKLSILSREEMSDLRNALQLTFIFYYYYYYYFLSFFLSLHFPWSTHEQHSLMY